MSLFVKPLPTIPLGTTTGGLFRRPVLGLPLGHLGTHGHVIGITDSGKSRFLASYFLELHQRGYGVTLIDPHGDLAELILGALVEENNEALLERLTYLDLPEGERRGLYIPFNVLTGLESHYTRSRNVLEAFHRAWPSLAGGGAPRFDKLVLNGVKVLLANGGRLPELFRFLTERDYRYELLYKESDPDVLATWRWYDALPERLRLDYADSTLSRVNLLTFSPALKHSLGQRENVLDFRAIMDESRSLIVNLRLSDRETSRILGCLLTVLAEQAAFSRANAVERPLHVLIVDEFAEFSAQSEEALSTMLSQTRKYGLFVVMSHQTWTQASERLRGAMGNARLKVAFKLEREDAERTALEFAKVDTLAVKHIVEVGQERSHPLFYSIPEQYEGQIRRIQELPKRQALVKLPDNTTHEITTLEVRDPQPDPQRLAAVKAEYLARYFRPAVARPSPTLQVRKR